MKRFAPWALAAALAVAAVPVAWAQEPATVIEVGWWTRRPGAQAKPAGGFEVAFAPDGDLSVAAARVDVRSDVSSAMLALTESGGVARDVAAMQACPGPGGWQPANPGPWDQRPESDCDRLSVPLARDGESGEWRANILPLLQEASGPTSIVVQPDPDAMETPVPVGFQVEFSGARVEAQAGEPAPAAPQPQPQDGGGGFPAAEQGGGFDVPQPPPGGAAPSVAEPSPMVSEPAPPEDLAVPEAEGEPGGQFAARALGDDPESRPWIRIAWLLPLAMLVGAAGAAGRRFLLERGWLMTS